MHKWWATLKDMVFGNSTGIPLLFGPGCLLVSEPVGKADLLLKTFQNKQSLGPIDLPPTCHPMSELRSVAFQLSDLCRLLLDLSDHGGVDPTGVFPLFF